MKYSTSSQQGDAHIVLELDLPGEVRLLINGTVRVAKVAKAVDGASFYLSTPLQIGYEDHAHVEAKATFGKGAVNAELFLNGVVIAGEKFAVTD